MAAITQEFTDSLSELFRLHMMKLRWLVPPLKSLSLGQGYRLVSGAKLRPEGFNFTGYKNWQGVGVANNQVGESMYMGKAKIISPMDYLKLPSHLAEMARVDRFAAMCGSKRDDPQGLSPKPIINPVIDGVFTFLGAWAGTDDWNYPISPEKWNEWMEAQNIEVAFYLDGSIVRYSGGLRAGGYWNWPLKFDAITGKNYYNPKSNPRSSDDVEAILKGLSTGSITEQPAAVTPLAPKQPTVPQTETAKKPTTAPKDTKKAISKLRSKSVVKRNSVAPVSRLKKKK